MTNKLIVDLEQELDLLRKHREQVVARAARMCVTDANSRHLGHNLGNTANEISELAAKIDSVDSILRYVRTLAAFAETK